MKNKNTPQLAFRVLSDSITNNKALLGTGAFLGVTTQMCSNGIPKINMASVYYCFASTKPYLPYLYAAVGGAIVFGIGKIVLNSFCKSLEEAQKEKYNEIL